MRVSHVVSCRGCCSLLHLRLHLLHHHRLPHLWLHSHLRLHTHLHWLHAHLHGLLHHGLAHHRLHGVNCRVRLIYIHWRCGVHCFIVFVWLAWWLLLRLNFDNLWLNIITTATTYFSVELEFFADEADADIGKESNNDADNCSGYTVRVDVEVNSLTFGTRLFDHIVICIITVTYLQRLAWVTEVPSLFTDIVAVNPTVNTNKAIIRVLCTVRCWIKISDYITTSSRVLTILICRNSVAIYIILGPDFHFVDAMSSGLSTQSNSLT